MLLRITCAFLLLSSTTLAIPATTGQSTKEDVSFKSSIREKLAGPPKGWVKDENVVVDKTSMMRLRIHLVQQDMDKFHKLAMDVSNPILKVHV
jgi:tripeptidyl-peptidase I